MSHDFSILLSEASDIQERLLEINTFIVERESEVLSSLSEVDKKVNDCYHILELMDLDAIKMTVITKKLKTALRERRVLKDAVSVIDAIKRNPNNLFDPKDLKNRVETRRQRHLSLAKEAMIKHFEKQ